MPTKAQTNNLKPIKKGELSKDEAKRRGSIGGKASVEARRQKKLFKEEILKRMSEKDWDEMIANLIEKSKVSTKDFEVLRDTIGQKPIQDINVTTDAEEFEFKFKYSK